MVNFLCFGILSFNHIHYFTRLSPIRRDIVLVMQFLQIDLPRFCFTELGSKTAILLKNNMHNFYKCQKEYVPAFYKIIWQSIMYPFLCPLEYISTILILRLDLRDRPGAGHRVAQIYIYTITPPPCAVLSLWNGSGSNPSMTRSEELTLWSRWDSVTQIISYTHRQKLSNTTFFRRHCFGSCRTEYVGNGNQIFGILL